MFVSFYLLFLFPTVCPSVQVIMPPKKGNVSSGNPRTRTRQAVQVEVPLQGASEDTISQCVVPANTVRPDHPSPPGRVYSRVRPTPGDSVSPQPPSTLSDQLGVIAPTRHTLLTAGDSSSGSEFAATPPDTPAQCTPPVSHFPAVFSEPTVPFPRAGAEFQGMQSVRLDIDFDPQGTLSSSCAAPSHAGGGLSVRANSVPAGLPQRPPVSRRVTFGEIITTHNPGDAGSGCRGSVLLEGSQFPSIGETLSGASSSRASNHTDWGGVDLRRAPRVGAGSDRRLSDFFPQAPSSVSSVVAGTSSPSPTGVACPLGKRRFGGSGLWMKAAPASEHSRNPVLGLERTQDNFASSCSPAHSTGSPASKRTGAVHSTLQETHSDADMHTDVLRAEMSPGPAGVPNAWVRGEHGDVGGCITPPVAANPSQCSPEDVGPLWDPIVDWGIGRPSWPCGVLQVSGIVNFGYSKYSCLMGTYDGQLARIVCLRSLHVGEVVKVRATCSIDESWGLGVSPDVGMVVIKLCNTCRGLPASFSCPGCGHMVCQRCALEKTEMLGPREDTKCGLEGHSCTVWWTGSAVTRSSDSGVGGDRPCNRCGALLAQAFAPGCGHRVCVGCLRELSALPGQDLVGFRCGRSGVWCSELPGLQPVGGDRAVPPSSGPPPSPSASASALLDRLDLAPAALASLSALPLTQRGMSANDVRGGSCIAGSSSVSSLSITVVSPVAIHTDDHRTLRQNCAVLYWDGNDNHPSAPMYVQDLVGDPGGNQELDMITLSRVPAGKVAVLARPSELLAIVQEAGYVLHPSQFGVHSFGDIRLAYQDRVFAKLPPYPNESHPSAAAVCEVVVPQNGPAYVAILLEGGGGLVCCPARGVSKLLDFDGGDCPLPYSFSCPGGLSTWGCVVDGCSFSSRVLVDISRHVASSHVLAGPRAPTSAVHGAVGPACSPGPADFRVAQYVSGYCCRQPSRAGPEPSDNLEGMLSLESSVLEDIAQQQAADHIGSRVPDLSAIAQPLAGDKALVAVALLRPGHEALYTQDCGQECLGVVLSVLESPLELSYELKVGSGSSTRVVRAGVSRVRRFFFTGQAVLYTSAGGQPQDCRISGIDRALQPPTVEVEFSVPGTALGVRHRQCEVSRVTAVPPIVATGFVADSHPPVVHPEFPGVAVAPVGVCADSGVDSVKDLSVIQCQLNSGFSLYTEALAVKTIAAGHVCQLAEVALPGVQQCFDLLAGSVLALTEARMAPRVGAARFVISQLQQSVERLRASSAVMFRPLEDMDTIVKTLRSTVYRDRVVAGTLWVPMKGTILSFFIRGESFEKHAPVFIAELSKLCSLRTTLTVALQTNMKVPAAYQVDLRVEQEWSGLVELLANADTPLASVVLLLRGACQQLLVFAGKLKTLRAKMDLVSLVQQPVDLTGSN